MCVASIDKRLRVSRIIEENMKQEVKFSSLTLMELRRM